MLNIIKVILLRNENFVPSQILLTLQFLDAILDNNFD